MPGARPGCSTLSSGCRRQPARHPACPPRLQAATPSSVLHQQQRSRPQCPRLLACRATAALRSQLGPRSSRRRAAGRSPCSQQRLRRRRRLPPRPHLPPRQPWRCCRPTSPTLWSLRCPRCSSSSCSSSRCRVRAASTWMPALGCCWWGRACQTAPAACARWVLAPSAAACGSQLLLVSRWPSAAAAAAAQRCWWRAHRPHPGSTDQPAARATRHPPLPAGQHPVPWRAPAHPPAPRQRLRAGH
jgi:hypothetical protein